MALRVVRRHSQRATTCFVFYSRKTCSSWGLFKKHTDVGCEIKRLVYLGCYWCDTKKLFATCQIVRDVFADSFGRASLKWCSNLIKRTSWWILCSSSRRQGQIDGEDVGYVCTWCIWWGGWNCTNEFGSFSFISFTVLSVNIAFKLSRRFQLYPQDLSELFLSIVWWLSCRTAYWHQCCISKHKPTMSKDIWLALVLIWVFPKIVVPPNHPF